MVVLEEREIDSFSLDGRQRPLYNNRVERAGQGAGREWCLPVAGLQEVRRCVTID